ncbi:MAG: aldehyde dehydrogenase family protein [Thermoplasmata archaeon]|nr:aldehyde dehydrogenase family protein [Thermoplasmata archaeon]
MSYRNENTFFRAGQSGRVEIIHANYERALRKLESELGNIFQNYIGGQWAKSRGGLFEDRYPGDLSVLNQKFQLSKQIDARKAINAAKKAFESWRMIDYQERCRIFEHAAFLMSRRKHDLAAIVTLENGKNRYEAMADIDEAIDFLRYYSYQLRINNGYSMDMSPPFPNEHPTNLLKPYGVWAVVSPFNFPFAIMAGMSTGAMITGNTVVVKPASDTPWPPFIFAKILEEAGLPKGVFNVVAGPGDTVGRELVENNGISGFVFTGSRAVGIGAMQKFLGKKPRPFIAEMGGKNAVIVTKNADIDEAAEGVAKSAFGFSGQKCSACSRVLVDRSIYTDFIKRLKVWTEGIVVGDPRERETYLGPLINDSALQKYVKSTKAAKASGKVVIGGKILRSKDLNGYYVSPTVVSGLKANHPLVINELFIPFVCVLKMSSLQQAVRIANSSEYGLTSGLMSRDRDEIEYYMNNIEAGTIYANRRSGASTAAMVGSQPFVGWKMSATTWKAAGGRYYLPQFMREQSQTRCA